MDSDIRATKNCLYIEQDNNIVPINLNDIVRIWLSDESDRSWYTGYGPLYFINIFVIDKSHGGIKTLDLAIHEDEMISDLKEILNSSFFSVEVFDGVYHFYNASFDWKPGSELCPNWVKVSRKDMSLIEIVIDKKEYPQFLAAKEEYLKQKEKPYECTDTMDR